jgi:hypothetical protein
MRWRDVIGVLFDDVGFAGLFAARGRPAERAALEAAAANAPEWLKSVVEPDWLIRYGPRVEGYRLPKSESERAWLQRYDQDEQGFHWREHDRPGPPTRRTVDRLALRSGCALEHQTRSGLGRIQSPDQRGLR